MKIQILCLLMICLLFVSACMLPTTQEISVLDHENVMTVYTIKRGTLRVYSGFARFRDINDNRVYIKDFKAIREL